MSYSRKDSDYAALLYAWLAERFGPHRIFWDREDIDPGDDYRRSLSRRLSDCNALVALIGPGWTPSPWIQRELGAALKRNVLVLPILVGETPRLDSVDLPKKLSQLAFRQTLEIRDLRFRERLVGVLAPVMSGVSNPKADRDDLLVPRLSRMLLKQSDQAQRRGLELLVDDQIEAALDILADAFEMLMALLELSPGDADLELRLGFLYKDLAQGFDRDPPRFRRYTKSGLQTFEGLLRRKLARSTEASAWNGLGNICILSGDTERAVECCLRAVQLDSDYAFAWGDLLRAYNDLAQKGDIRLGAMRNALKHLNATHGNDCLLVDSLPDYSAIVEQWESKSPRRAGRRTAR